MYIYEVLQNKKQKSGLTAPTESFSMSATNTGESPFTLNPKPSLGARSKTTDRGADQSLKALKTLTGP